MDLLMLAEKTRVVPVLAYYSHFLQMEDTTATQVAVPIKSALARQEIRSLEQECNRTQRSCSRAQFSTQVFYCFLHSDAQSHVPGTPRPRAGGKQMPSYL